MTDTDSVITAEPKRHSSLVGLLIRLVKEKPLATVGGVIVLLMFFTGIFADFISPYEMDKINLEVRLVPPSNEHWLGTDHLGRDVLSRIIYGARISMIVSVLASLMSTTIAIVIGCLSGFLAGKFDLTVQRFVDAWMCLPPLLIILTIMSLLGPGLFQLIIVLGVFTGIRDSRVLRSAVIGIKENVYIEAAHSVGAPTWRTLARHILPNVMAPVIIIFTIAMAQMILAEATVSFLGFGIPPPMPSWGAMLSEEGRSYMFGAPWLAIWPGLSISIVVYGINMLGDGLRDILDPRLRGSMGRLKRVKIKKILVK